MTKGYGFTRLDTETGEELLFDGYETREEMEIVLAAVIAFDHAEPETKTVH